MTETPVIPAAQRLAELFNGAESAAEQDRILRAFYDSVDRQEARATGSEGASDFAPPHADALLRTALDRLTSLATQPASRPAPEVMPECYVPRNLTAEQLAHLYAQSKQQAEAEVASAWMNCVLTPNDPVRQSVYSKARLALADLEADERRVLGGS